MTKNQIRIAFLIVPLVLHVPSEAAQLDTAGRIIATRKELLASSREDNERLRSPGYLTGRIGQLKGLIRGEILRQLNTTQWRDSTLLRSLAPALDEDWNKPISLIHKQLNGLDVVILGYAIPHGGSAQADSTVVIEAFRKPADRYEPADQTGDGLANSLAKLEELPGPSTNEIWFLGHGQQTGVMQYHERARIYSFDGQHFKELWGHEPLRQASFQIGKDQLRIDFEMEEGPPMVLTLALLPQGPREISLLRRQ